MLFRINISKWGDICTLYNAILRIARNFLKTRENIKISTHPFYHINLGWFSWEWSKKKYFFSEKKIQNGKLKNAFSVLFGCFRAFVGQPHGHILWATSMPFASFNPTNPRTHLRNFREKFLRIGDFEKWAFFESAILNFFFEKKKKKLLHSHENQPKFIWYNGWVEIMMFSLVSRKFLAMRNIALYSVGEKFREVKFLKVFTPINFTR